MKTAFLIATVSTALVSMAFANPSEQRGGGGGAGEQIGLTGGADRHGEDPFDGRSRDEIKDDDNDNKSKQPDKPAYTEAQKYFDKTKKSFIDKIRDARDRIKKFQRELDEGKKTGKGRNLRDIEKDLKDAEDDLKKQQQKLDLTSDEMKTQVAQGIIEADAEQMRLLAKKMRETARQRREDAEKYRKEAADAFKEADKHPKGSKERADAEKKADNANWKAAWSEDGADDADRVARDADKEAGRLEKQAEKAGSSPPR